MKTLQSVPNDLLKEGIHQTLIRDQKDRYNYGIICIIYIMSTTSIGSLFDNLMQVDFENPHGVFIEVPTKAGL